MSIFSIKPQQQDAFINAPEIYQGVQLGYFQDDQDQGYCIVVNAMIGIDLRGDLRAELDYFVGQTWRPTGPLRGFNYEQRYQIYWENCPQPLDSPVLTDRASLPSTLTLTTPPPPPGRPSLIPGAPLGRGTLPPTVGHLPFSTNVLVDEVFYRWDSGQPAGALILSPTLLPLGPLYRQVPKCHSRRRDFQPYLAWRSRASFSYVSPQNKSRGREHDVMRSSRADVRAVRRRVRYVLTA